MARGTVAPAILVYSKTELMQRIDSVPSAKTLHIDIMDGKFVNNTTLEVDGLHELPHDKEIEYHLMVSNPAEYIRQLPGGKNKIFQVHIESVLDEEVSYIRHMVEKKKARLAWALNPPTPISRIELHLGGVVGILLMTVNPGWAGQKYMEDVEKKMRALRDSYPDLAIEIDGGVSEQTILRALAAGANRFAAASAVFGQPEPDAALAGLLRIVNSYIDKKRA